MPKTAPERLMKFRLQLRWPSLVMTAIGIFAALLPGCAVGPDYHRPHSLQVPPTFSSSSTSGLSVVTTQAPLTNAWWLAFQDPKLDRIVSMATTNSHDIRRAQARLLEARALWTAARFDFVPTIQGQAGYEKSKNSKDGAGNRNRRSELYRAGFDASWELDLWGAVRRNVEAARATVDAVEASLDDVVVSIQAEVAANYLELRGIQAQLNVASRNATNQAQTLNLAIALRDGGQGTQFDVARARSLLNATLATIPSLDGNLQRTIHRLSILCGLPPAALAPDLVDPQPIPNPPQQLVLNEPTELLRQRPDVRAAERSLAAATARIGVVTADLFPRVTFHGSLGLEAARLSGLTDNGSDKYSFGPRISWEALNLGRVRQQIKAASARTEQALAVYEQTALLALEEAENSLLSLGHERQRLGYLTEAERSASEAVDLARQRYRDGIADYLSVLDAERTLLNLQEQLAVNQTLNGTQLIAVYKAFAAGRGAR